MGQRGREKQQCYLLVLFYTQTTNLQEKASRTLYHLQYTSWPDHGVPDTAVTALNFVRAVRSFVESDHGPIVVHCRYVVQGVELSPDPSGRCVGVWCSLLLYDACMCVVHVIYVELSS